MNELSCFFVEIINILILKSWYSILFQISIGLQSVKPSDRFHQSKMISFKYRSFPYTDFNIFTLKSRALELQPILNFSVNINNSHHFLAAWAFSIFRQEPFFNHPFQTPLEFTTYPKYFNILIQTFLYHITLNFLVSILFDFVQTQS